MAFLSGPRQVGKTTTCRSLADAYLKLGDTRLSPALAHFQAQIKAPHAFQAVLNLPYEASNCFTTDRPLVVPAKTLLSQLL